MTIKVIKLTKAIRAVLKEFAKALVESDTTITKEIDDLYEKISTQIKKTTITKFPLSDMEILKKYRFAEHKLTIIMVSEYDSSYRTWTYKKDELNLPLCPITRSIGKTPQFTIDKYLAKAIDSYKILCDGQEDKKQHMLDDYYTVIENARYFKQILEIWPEAKPIYDMFVNSLNLSSVADTNVIERIQLDMEKRQNKGIH